MLQGGRYDPEVHKPGDNMAHVDVSVAVQVGEFIRDYLLGLDEATCASLTAR